MATLYELSNNLAAVIDGGFVIDEETGEIIYDATDIERLEATYIDKVEGCALYVKDLEALASAIKAEEKALADRRRVLENKARRLREYILANIIEQRKIETPRVSLSCRTSKAVEVLDVDALPDQFTRTETTVKPDKRAIKEAIEAGEHVNGAALVVNQNLQIK